MASPAIHYKFDVLAVILHGWQIVAINASTNTDTCLISVYQVTGHFRRTYFPLTMRFQEHCVRGITISHPLPHPGGGGGGGYSRNMVNGGARL